jgi:hypothetical protein
MLGLLLGIIAFAAALVLDWKAAIAARERDARRMIKDLLRTASSLDAQAANLSQECSEKAAKLRALARQAEAGASQATNLANQIRGTSLAAAQLKTQADNLRFQASEISTQQTFRNPNSFSKYLRQFQFSARTIASKALAGLAALGAISSIITILQNELEKINDDANKIMEEPCDEGSGISNLGINEAELLELLNLE